MKQSSDSSRRTMASIFGISQKARTPFIRWTRKRCSLETGTIRETGVEVVFRPTDFTQVNHRLNEVMVTRALRLRILNPRLRSSISSAGSATLRCRWQPEQRKFLVLKAAPSWSNVHARALKTITSRIRPNLRLVICLTGHWTIGMPFGISSAV